MVDAGVLKVFVNAVSTEMEALLSRLPWNAQRALVYIMLCANAGVKNRGTRTIL